MEVNNQYQHRTE
ncbi:unnamed protein product, partial [Rotaria magnacalcarata]